MKKTLWTLLLLWASSAIKGLMVDKGGHMEMTRLKMSLAYVRTIKTFRLLFMSFLSMGVCLILLSAGLFLFHFSLFLYAPWSMETKLLVGLLFSVVYLLAAFAMFSQIIAPEKWLKIFHADTILDHLHKEAFQKDVISTNEKGPIRPST